MKEDRRIIKRSGLKKPGKQLPKKKGAKRNFAWKYAEEPVIEEKHGEESRNHNYRVHWQRKDRL